MNASSTHPSRATPRILSTLLPAAAFAHVACTPWRSARLPAHLCCPWGATAVRWHAICTATRPLRAPLSLDSHDPIRAYSGRSIRRCGCCQPLRNEGLRALDHARRVWCWPACQAMRHIREQRQLDIPSRRAVQLCDLLDHALWYTLIGRALN